MTSVGFLLCKFKTCLSFPHPDASFELQLGDLAMRVIQLVVAVGAASGIGVSREVSTTSQNACSATFGKAFYTFSLSTVDENAGESQAEFSIRRSRVIRSICRVVSFISFSLCRVESWMGANPEDWLETLK